MKKSLEKLILQLSNIDGISSREENVANYIKQHFENNKNFSIERDGLGSIAVIKKTNEKYPTISFTAHMDEVGFIVTKIEKNGLIKFAPIGGWWGHVLLGKRLKIITDNNVIIKGVVGSIPPHILTDEVRKNVISLDKMFIDIGVSTYEEVKKLGIQPGNMITPDSESFVGSDGDAVFGKAFDNRASVAIGMEIMKQIESKKLNCNVIFVGSTQEEVGLRGAKTSTFKWTPDVAFALDVTIANDMPGMEDKDTKLRTGVALSLFDRSVIGNYKLVKEMETICKDNKIKYTFDGLAQGGTDAGSIHLTKDGVITMTLSIPSRYIHSHNSSVAISDLESTTNALLKFIEKFDEKMLSKLSYK